MLFSFRLLVIDKGNSLWKNHYIPAMLELIDYKIKWVIRKGKAIKLTIPIYKDMGRGGGLGETISKGLLVPKTAEPGRKIA